MLSVKRKKELNETVIKYFEKIKDEFENEIIMERMEYEIEEEGIEEYMYKRFKQLIKNKL